MHRPQRLLMQWHLTERCNLRCSHCYQNAYDDHAGLADWLPVLEQFRAFLAGDSARIPGHITLTGGEPFAHRDTPALLDRLAALRHEFSFAVLCNGTLIDAGLARRLADWAPRFVQVSIDGRPETHDALRGAGNHAAVVEAVRHLVGAGVRTMISFTAHRDNYREFADVAQLGRELRVARVWADRLIPQGQGGRLQGLSVEETREFIDSMRLAAMDAEAAISGPFGRRTEVALHRALQFLGGGPAYKCTAADSLITVMPDGTLYPCRRLPLEAGNLHRTPLAELYQGALFRSLRDPQIVADGCRACVYERLCRGGLRCISHATTGSWNASDPGCWLAAAPATTAPAAAAAATAARAP